jgi:hypothetical protein
LYWLPVFDIPFLYDLFGIFQLFLKNMKWMIYLTNRNMWNNNDIYYNISVSCDFLYMEAIILKNEFSLISKLLFYKNLKIKYKKRELPWAIFFDFLFLGFCKTGVCLLNWMHSLKWSPPYIKSHMIHLYCNICRFYFTCYDWSNISLTSYSSRKVGRYQIDLSNMISLSDDVGVI